MQKLQIGLAIVTIVAVAIVWTLGWFAASGRSSIRSEENRSHPSGAPVAERKEAADSPANQNPEKSFDLDPKDPVILEAKRRYATILNEMESRRAKPLFERKGANGITVVAVAISAPTPDEIGIAANGIGEILAEVEPARRDDVRPQLERLYNQYTGFSRAYRVLYASVHVDWPNVPVDEVEFERLSDAFPAEDGQIKYEVGLRTYIVDKAWQERYGHLLKLEKENERTGNSGMKP